MTATTVSVPRYSTLVQLVDYTFKVLVTNLAIWPSASTARDDGLHKSNSFANWCTKSRATNRVPNHHNEKVNIHPREKFRI